MGAASPLVATAKGPRHYSAGELAQVALLARINRMKTLVLQAMGAFHDHAERATAEGAPLCPSFKRAYATLVVQLQYCNRLAAPVLREMPTWPIGGGAGGGSAYGGGAPRSDTQVLKEVAIGWLKKMSQRCEHEADNTLEIAAKGILQRHSGFTLQAESKRLIHDSVMLVHYVQHVASMHELFLQSEINVALDMALTRIRPLHPENQTAFARVEKLVRDITQFLSDPDRKE